MWTKVTFIYSNEQKSKNQSKGQHNLMQSLSNTTNASSMEIIGFGIISNEEVYFFNFSSNTRIGYKQPRYGGLSSFSAEVKIVIYLNSRNGFIRTSFRGYRLLIRRI